LTGGASKQAPGCPPGIACATGRALEALRPPNPLQISGARCLRREPPLEFLNRSRVIHAAHGMRVTLAHHYILYLRERNGYPQSRCSFSGELWVLNIAITRAKIHCLSRGALKTATDRLGFQNPVTPNVRTSAPTS
jgi:hypothetical protein